MAGRETRNLWLIVLRNFLNSFRPRQIRGNDMGKDYLGNRYFEIPADPSVGKRKASRWYDPPKGLDFQDPIPAEWESWLRMKRKDPPTAEEIAQNIAVAKLKKENAAKIEAERLSEGGSLPTVPRKGQGSFPVYQDMPFGDPENNNNKHTLAAFQLLSLGILPPGASNTITAAVTLVTAPGGAFMNSSMIQDPIYEIGKNS